MLRNSLKLIIFDFDGTLVDSRSLILESHRDRICRISIACRHRPPTVSRWSESHSMSF